MVVQASASELSPDQSLRLEFLHYSLDNVQERHGGIGFSFSLPGGAGWPDGADSKKAALRLPVLDSDFLLDRRRRAEAFHADNRRVRRHFCEHARRLGMAREDQYLTLP